MSRPSILIANDDGIFAPGIYALWEAMSEIGETTVVAPNTEKSAVGHAITISDPIRIEKVKRSGGFRGYAVNGTPADSVKIAVKAIMDKKTGYHYFWYQRGGERGPKFIVFWNDFSRDRRNIFRYSIHCNQFRCAS